MHDTPREIERSLLSNSLAEGGPKVAGGAYDILFEPVRIGPKTMRNRFYQVPHCNGAGTDRPGMQASLREMKAEGGWAAVFTEYVCIAPEADHSPFVLGTIWDDDDVANLSLMCDRVHAHGSLAGIQLGYGGAYAANRESRLVGRGPSQYAVEAVGGLLGYTAEAITDADITAIQRLYVDAALRARDAGFDIIQVEGGAGIGPTQFLSPYFNKRTDKYGGSFENRVRFWRELLDQLKEAVGDDCALSCRVSMDDLRADPEAPSLQECMSLIEAVDGAVDMWDVNMGSSDWGEDIGTARFYDEDAQSPWQVAIREYTDKPIAGVGRYTSPDLMAAIVRSGRLDLIGAARPSIADPFLPVKIEQGRVEDIRECIGCNACVARWDSFSPIVCTQNATMGEEYRRGWHPERFTRSKNADRNVIVIGAGPAGLECARVLGERGMAQVHLIDASSDVGGSVRWISELPGLRPWGRIVDYRRTQLDKLSNVTTLTGMRLSVDQALDYGAELVVVATGSHFCGDGSNFATHAPLPGADASLPYCLTPEQIMVDGKPVPDGPVVVFDADGYVAGIGLAERLSREGHDVVYVTPFGNAGSYTMHTGEYPNIARRFHELGIVVMTETMVTAVAPGEVNVEYVFGEGLRHFPDADGQVRRSDHRRVESIAACSIVLAGARQSNDEIYRGLQARREEWDDAGIQGVFRIGDCVAPRHLAEVVFDGHRLAREIDEPDPSVAKTYLRERRLILTPR